MKLVNDYFPDTHSPYPIKEVIMLTLKLDLETVSEFSNLAKHFGFDTFEEYLNHMLQKERASIINLITLDEDQMDRIITHIIVGATEEAADDDDCDLWKHNFKFLDLYNYMSEKPQFTYPKWNSLSKNSKIELGKRFKVAAQDFRDTAKQNDVVIVQTNKHVNNSVVYMLLNNRF